MDISAFVTLLNSLNYDVVFCKGFKPLPQTGQVCKLVAGATVQEYLVNSQAHSQQVLPVHKSRFFEESLRHRAKIKVNSRVGEVYGPAQMEQVFNYNNFNTKSYCITEKAVYEKFLISALNQLQPVLVYFDVSPRIGPEHEQGKPVQLHGEFEHSAAIVGYYYNSKRDLILIAAQWGNFYSIAFDKLFESTSQLSSLKHPEHFQKYYSLPGVFDKRIWREKNQMALAIDHLCRDQRPWLRMALSWLSYLWPKEQERFSLPPEDSSGSLANVLTVITGDSKSIELESFSRYQLPSEVTLEPDSSTQPCSSVS
jgi:hypothetical protein